MKFTDVRTIKTLIKEYGMDNGSATYGSNKSVAAPSASPSNKSSSSPTTKKAPQSPTTTGPTKKEQPKILAVRASDVPADAVVKDIEDKPMGKVVSRVGDKPKADALVVDTGKPGQNQYQVLDKNQKVFIDNPEYQEEDYSSVRSNRGLPEGKVKLYTDPNYFGAEVDDTGFDSLPVKNISINQLIGFEPDSKMQDPKAKANVKKILAGLEAGNPIPPILVRKYKDGYQVLDGHHRFWAYKVAKKDTIPARIVDPKDIEEVGKQGVAEGSAAKLISKLKIKNKKVRSIKKILRNSEGNEQNETVNAGNGSMKESIFAQFEKLSLEEQLKILERVDSTKLNEIWSKKYKDSINCSKPKGFSQKAHCAGKKTTTEGDMIGRKLLRRDAYKAAVDALAGVLARKMTTKKHSTEYYAARVAQSYPGVDARELTSMYNDLVNETGELSENLRKWFKDKWVRFGPDGKIKGDCARGDDSEGKPKCLPQSKAHSLGKDGRASAAARKRREDPNPERKGAAKNVATKKESVVEYTNIPFNVCPSCGDSIVHESQLQEKQDACYHKVKARYKVWPSAYASGALVQCRKKGAKNWGNSKKESVAESAVPDNRKVRILNKIMAKPLLASDLGAQMEAFFAIPDPRMVNEFRKQRAMAGDDIDLRPVVKGFIGNVLHPDLQKQVNVSESVINEYDDLGKEKAVIIKTVSGLDAADKEQAYILDRIYKILNSGQISSNIDVAFTKPLVDENLPEAEKANVRKDMTRIISSLEQDYGSMKKFLDRLDQAGGVVNIAELAKPLNTFEKVFGDDPAIAAFITLANYGVGKKQKGPGEYALACLSNQIKLAEGEGDLQISGIGKTELKAALSSAGGRIGYGGGSQKSKRAVIDKYAKYLPTVLARLNAGAGGSISIRPFIDALNTDLPTNTPFNVQIRKALMTDLLVMDLEKFAAPVADKFSTSMSFDEIETEYLIQNFAWYKDRDDFDALLLIHVPNRKTAMIRNAEDLITFRNSGHANATSISIVPTQAGAGREQWAQLTLNKAKAG